MDGINRGVRLCERSGCTREIGHVGDCEFETRNWIGIKPHCMGTAFPDEKWEKWDHEAITRTLQEILPTAADLDAVAEEQRVKEETDGRE
jgi:hypothetical protein